MRMALEHEISETSKLKSGDCFWTSAGDTMLFGIAVNTNGNQTHAIVMEKTPGGQLGVPEIYRNIWEHNSPVILERQAQIFASCAVHAFDCSPEPSRSLPGELTVSEEGAAIAVMANDRILRIDIEHGRFSLPTSPRKVVFRSWDLIVLDTEGKIARRLPMTCAPR